MSQLPLFASKPKSRRLETSIGRVGDTLSIPEGIHTIPCTHGMHRFPGKFIPNLPRYLLRWKLKHRVSETVCDPFCGSGTTLVEAALEGRSFIGMDIDPLAVMIATAKTQPLSENELGFLGQHWRDYNYDRENPDLIPSVPNLAHWFSNRAVAQLSAIKSGCLSLPPKIRLLSLVVFSSIIRRVSNADDQTQKTYVSHTLPKKPPPPAKLFPIFLQRAINGMKEYLSLLPRPVVGHVVQGDARNPPDIEFDDVITSPPYIDSIDYLYNQMLEYFWLLDELGVNSYENYCSLRKRLIGLSHTSPDNGGYLNERLSSATRRTFQGACRLIRDRSHKEESIVRTFFQNLENHCEATYGRQRQGGFYICIVGNSMVRKVIVPTAELFVDLFRSVGYKLEGRMTYEIRRHYMKFPRRSNSGKIKRDHVLVFRR